MGTTITGKLNRQAHEFQAGNSIGFGVRVGVQYYDRKTKQKEWANYEAAVFTNNDNQAAFLRSNLVSGAIIELSASVAYPTLNESNGTQYLGIKLDDVKLGYVSAPDAGQQPQQAAVQPQPQPQQAPQQAPQQQYQQQAPQQVQQQAPVQQAPVQQAPAMDGFEDIPF